MSTVNTPPAANAATAAPSSSSSPSPAASSAASSSAPAPAPPAPPPASSSPITQVEESPITQVSPVAATPNYYNASSSAFPSRLVLDLRGTRFEIERETLVGLPESILVVMFPNGLILRPPPPPPPSSVQQQQQQQQFQRQGAAGAGMGSPSHGLLRRGGAAGQHPSDSSYGTDYSEYTDYSYDEDDDDLYEKDDDEEEDEDDEEEDEEDEDEECEDEDAGRGVGNAQNRDQASGLQSVAAPAGASPGTGATLQEQIPVQAQSEPGSSKPDPPSNVGPEAESQPRAAPAEEDDQEEDEDDELKDETEAEEEQVIFVDFDPVCLNYILDFYRQAQRVGEDTRRQRQEQFLQQQQRQWQLQQQQFHMQQQQLLLQQQEEQQQQQLQEHLELEQQLERQIEQQQQVAKGKDSNSSESVDANADSSANGSAATATDASNADAVNSDAVIDPSPLSPVNMPDAPSSAQLLQRQQELQRHQVQRQKLRQVVRQQQQHLQVQQQQLHQQLQQLQLQMQQHQQFQQSIPYGNTMLQPNPLLTKQAIIVLREELDYFVIPMSGSKRLPTELSTSTSAVGPSSTTPTTLGERPPSVASTATTAAATVSATARPAGSERAGTSSSLATRNGDAEQQPQQQQQQQQGGSDNGQNKEAIDHASVPVSSQAASNAATAPRTVTRSDSVLVLGDPSLMATPGTAPRAAGALHETPTQEKSAGGVNEPTLATATAPEPKKLLIKTECGHYLLEDRKIFTALQRNIDKEQNMAEQHLMDMLCVSGFKYDGDWGYRRLEPKRTTVVSVAMVMLKTSASSTSPYQSNAPSTTPSPPPPTTTTTTSTATAEAQVPDLATAAATTDKTGERDSTISTDATLATQPTSSSSLPPAVPSSESSPPAKGDGEEGATKVNDATSPLAAEGEANPTRPMTALELEAEAAAQAEAQRIQNNKVQMAIAQKLLLFWRKPARKCWWDGIQIELDHEGTKVPVRLWARRTWTLEVVLV